MSATETHPPGLVNHDRPTNHTDLRERAAVIELIAHVLGRAHRAAEANNEPDQARAILHVAHSFADELQSADPEFDRVQFIEAATGVRSA